MKRLLCLLLAAMLLLSTGCNRTPQAPALEAVASVQYATTEPESLASVLDSIYAKIEMKDLLDITDSEVLYSLFHVEAAWVQDYAVRYSSGRYGVADVAIFKPVEGRAEDVIAALEIRMSDCIADFENYNIHNSLSIAKNAQIFERGNYVIMLMVADTEAARTKILEQIPG